MSTYEEALAQHKKDYDKKLESIRLTYGLLNTILYYAKKKELSSFNIWSDSSSIYLSTKDPFRAELEIIPGLSETLNVRWNKVTTDEGFNYSTVYAAKNFSYSAYISLNLNLSDFCRIIKVATGNTTRVYRYVEEPEYETLIECKRVYRYVEEDD